MDEVEKICTHLTSGDSSLNLNGSIAEDLIADHLLDWSSAVFQGHRCCNLSKQWK